MGLSRVTCRCFGEFCPVFSSGRTARNEEVCPAHECDKRCVYLTPSGQCHGSRPDPSKKRRKHDEAQRTCLTDRFVSRPGPGLAFASAQATATVRATVCVKDSNNDNITPAAGSISYKIGSTNFFANTVDANGCRYQDFPVGTTNVEVWAVINNTTSAHLTKDLSSGPQQFDFNTKKMTLRLEQCDATPLNGATPRFGSGITFGTWFWPGGNTGSGSNAAGESAAEVFSGGTFSFDMGYQATAEQKLNIVIADPPQTLVWRTTKVTLNYSGAISYGGPLGDSKFFTKPSMELMPGTVKFHFRPSGANPGYTTDLTFRRSCAYTKTAAVLRLRDSNGNPLTGWHGAWRVYGADAVVCCWFDQR